MNISFENRTRKVLKILEHLFYPKHMLLWRNQKMAMTKIILSGTIFISSTSSVISVVGEKFVLLETNKLNIDASHACHSTIN